MWTCGRVSTYGLCHVTIIRWEMGVSNLQPSSDHWVWGWYLVSTQFLCRSGPLASCQNVEAGSNPLSLYRRMTSAVHFFCLLISAFRALFPESGPCCLRSTQSGLAWLMDQNFCPRATTSAQDSRAYHCSRLQYGWSMDYGLSISAYSFFA